jgi:hypothetical protein
MGLDKIIEADKEWKSSVNYILIKNNISKTSKEINDSLQINLHKYNKNSRALIESFQKNNKNYKKIDEDKKKKEEKEKKLKPKFDNSKY